MFRLTLTGSEADSSHQLASSIAERYGSAENPQFLQDASLIAQELPHRIRAILNAFRLNEPRPGVCVISGYEIDDLRIGPTPPHWNEQLDPSSTADAEIFFALGGSLLGDVFGWGTQQGGRLVHNIVPIQGHEEEQQSWSSEQTLLWHTEDAFDPHRADYLGLMCLRNLEKAGTTYGTVNLEGLDSAQLRVLFDPRYVIRPDESHMSQNKVGEQVQGDEGSHLLDIAYQRIEELSSDPIKVPAMFGDPLMPYLLLDADLLSCVSGDSEGQVALESLYQNIEANLADVVLQPGDVCFVDNYTTIHGRKSFKARYDGTDRWLKRINVTRDLRKSRSRRRSLAERLIF